MTTEHNKATPEGNVTCCPHVSDGASSTKEAPQPAPLSTFRPLACRSATIVVVTTWIDEVVGEVPRLPHRPPRLLDQPSAPRDHAVLQWGVCAEETGVVQDEMPRDVPTAIKRRIVIGQGLYAFGALLCVVSTYLSIAFIVLVYAAIKTNAYNWPDNTKVKAASEI